MHEEILKFICDALNNRSPLKFDGDALLSYRYLDAKHLDSFGLIQFIVEIEDEAMARNIVAHSDGDFSFYHPEDEGVLEGEKTEQKADEAPSQEGTSGTQETYTGEGTDEENENGLPDPDFEGAVTK